MEFDTFSMPLISGIAVMVCLLVWLMRESAGRKRSKRVEDYLRLERANGQDRGQRSTKQITAALGMSTAQVMDAAARSRAINRLAIAAGANSSETAVFEYALYRAERR